MDVALLGTPEATGILVLTSATHGVEGYCGSGVQVGLMHDDGFLRAARDARVAVLFVHAVNPHGFSHGRRVNEDNVDLNRNFRDFATPAPVNAAYADVHPLLLPATWPPAPENEAAIGGYLAEHGVRAFQAAVSGGQYAFPDGLFFGGTRPAWSNVTLRAVLRRHVVAAPAAGLDRLPHGPRPPGPRREDLRRTRRRVGSGAGPGVVGSRGHLRPRRLVIVGDRHRHGLRRRLRRMPGRRVHRNRARIRDGAAGRRSCRRCGPTIGCTIIRRRRRRCGRRSAGRCGARSTSRTTPGRNACTRRRARRRSRRWRISEGRCHDVRPERARARRPRSRLAPREAIARSPRLFTES